MKFEKGCFNCRDCYDKDCERCRSCDYFNLWAPPYWLEEWLKSFDTTSATKCFEAVNLLKEKFKNE